MFRRWESVATKTASGWRRIGAVAEHPVPSGICAREWSIATSDGAVVTTGGGRPATFGSRSEAVEALRGLHE